MSEDLTACSILSDSVSIQGHRLTTFEVKFPRFILAELNTHRMLSRNSASSRAIPTEKLIDQVLETPFVPAFATRVTGMGVGETLTGSAQDEARDIWYHAKNRAVSAANKLKHTDKSRVNRLLEPFMWHTAIVSATDWSNFFALRTDPGAQPEFRAVALMMKEAYLASTPSLLASSEWHVPLVLDREIEDDALGYPEPWTDWKLWSRISAGRCARVSYLTHDGRRDLQADLDLYTRLSGNGHLSPLEHPARPLTSEEWDVIYEAQEVLRCNLATGNSTSAAQRHRLIKQLEYVGNFHGWHQLRYDIPNQDDYSQQQGAVNQNG